MNTMWGALQQAIPDPQPAQGLWDGLVAPQLSNQATPTMQVASSELEQLRRILANDKNAKPIRKEIAPQSDQQILENLRRIIKDSGGMG